MAHFTVHPARSLQGVLTVPADKSISHRALLIGAISRGVTRIQNCLASQDVETSRRAVEDLGVRVETEDRAIRVEGVGLGGLRPPAAPLEMGNSGTTARLLLGILAGHPFAATLTGDDSLSRRPMRRVTEPLERMGARIEGPLGADRLPLTIHGGGLKGIRYTLPVASAQVKSALLLAGLHADGPTTVAEPIPSRDHTERMLRYFGARLEPEGLEWTIHPGQELQGRELAIPGDISSAAFFLVAAAIVPGSTVTVRGVGFNPTRDGIAALLSGMGAALDMRPVSEDAWEPVRDITVTGAPLRAIHVERGMIPRVIDELPVLMVAATQAEGTTVIEGAGELRVKETDRIRSMAAGLAAMKARIRVEGDSVLIDGPSRLKGAVVDSFSDHRTAMALAVAALVAEGQTTIEGSEWVGISFPGFFETLSSLTGR
ncbi:MAG: 3-phosphoshikimate 1-carboxyvinyltransferase [Candidatus Omnitrophica bacterium]|nr:3-phosphoshikimate 1-carboxyvinyltransferase [Candidatus Omnitrophota bacterium]